MKKTFRDTNVWRLSVSLAVDVCQLVTKFPAGERYDLGSQMKRSAISIPSNIAEGHGRFSTRDRNRFLGNARGSINELYTQLEIARRLCLIDHETYESTIDRLQHVARALAGLIRHTAERIE